MSVIRHPNLLHRQSRLGTRCSAPLPSAHSSIQPGLQSKQAPLAIKSTRYDQRMAVTTAAAAPGARAGMPLLSGLGCTSRRSQHVRCCYQDPASTSAGAQRQHADAHDQGAPAGDSDGTLERASSSTSSSSSSGDRRKAGSPSATSSSSIAANVGSALGINADTSSSTTSTSSSNADNADWLDDDMAGWLQAVERAALDPNRTVVFSVPSVTVGHDPNDVLHCPTLRHMLQPRPTPLLAKQCNWDGRFVSDDDRAMLNTLRFESPESAGAGATCTFEMSGSDDNQPAAATTASMPTAQSEVGLASSSPMDGILQSATTSTTPAMEYTGESDVASSAAAAVEAGAAAGVAAMGATPCNPDATTAVAAHALARQVPDASVMLQCTESGEERVCVQLPPFALRAGARDTVYFDPANVKAAIVVTGGICPGVNSVIEGMVKRLADYGVEEVLGIRFGIRGIVDESCAPVTLTKANTEGIHLTGGSILGAGAVLQIEDSASWPHAKERFALIKSKLQEWGINMLYMIGGEGGNRRAAQLVEWCRHERLPISVVGVPKSIENDLLLIDSCFGHATAVQEAQRPLISAKTEASSALRGVGIVKVKGRRSGHLAVTASLASGVVDAVLVPEVRFKLQGPGSLLEHIEHLLETQGHAVVCVAEGAGQEHIPDGDSTGPHPPLDAAGNPVLKDIGTFLKKKVKSSIDNVDVKYIDSAYLIESTHAAGDDNIYCRVLAYHAVDAAFAGYTGIIVGQAQTHYVLLPLQVVTNGLRRVDTKGMQWARLRGSGVWVGSDA